MLIVLLFVVPNKILQRDCLATDKLCWQLCCHEYEFAHVTFSKTLFNVNNIFILVTQDILNRQLQNYTKVLHT